MLYQPPAGVAQPLRQVPAWCWPPLNPGPGMRFQVAMAPASVETRRGPLRIAPEIRVTRWGDRNFGVSDAPLHSNLTQAELLIGFRF
jgi:hypothetical protein